MNSMFERCSSLKSLPNLSSWNLEKVNEKKDMFKNCIKP